MNIDSYFISDEFIELLKPISKNIESNQRILEYIIGVSLQYSILFRNGDELTTDGLSDFIKKTVEKISTLEEKFLIEFSIDRFCKKYVLQLYYEELLKKFNFTDELDENQEKKLHYYIAYQIMYNNYKFHAFNSYFFESIKENGIDHNISALMQEDLTKIDDLFVSRGIEFILGWQRLNCTNKTSYSMTPTVSYYYATNSPEWFANLTGTGVPFNQKTKYDKRAYIKNDYENAKNNLLMLMTEHKFTDKEMNFVIDFFDKKWSLYANQEPVLVIIPGEKYENLDKKIDSFFNPMGKISSKVSVLKYIDICFDSRQVDCRTSEVIDVTDAVFVSLPSYSLILQKLNFENKNQLTFNKTNKELK